MVNVGIEKFLLFWIRCEAKVDEPGTDGETILRETLLACERRGDAMRCVEGGRIVWRATPRMRSKLNDLACDPWSECDGKHYE